MHTGRAIWCAYKLSATLIACSGIVRPKAASSSAESRGLVSRDVVEAVVSHGRLRVPVVVPVPVDRPADCLVKVPPWPPTQHVTRPCRWRCAVSWPRRWHRQLDGVVHRPLPHALTSAVARSATDASSLTAGPKFHASAQRPGCSSPRAAPRAAGSPTAAPARAARAWSSRVADHQVGIGGQSPDGIGDDAVLGPVPPADDIAGPHRGQPDAVFGDAITGKNDDR